MKGRTLVILLILIVIITVGGIYWAMTSTINNLKEQQDEQNVSFVTQKDLVYPIIW